MNTNEHEHDEDVMEYNIIDAETFNDLYGADSLNELLDGGMCPECGSDDFELSQGDHTIMVKAVCNGEDCDFAFCDTQKAVNKFLK